MSHSSFARSLSDVSGGDGSLSRALLECSHSSNGSGNVTASVLLSKMRINSQKTPTRTPGRLPLTPCSVKKADHNVNSRRTPGHTNKTPAGCVKSILEAEGDRYIPNRKSTDLTRAQHAIKNDGENIAPEDAVYHRVTTECLNSGDTGDSRILRFKSDVRDFATSVPKGPMASPKKKVNSQRAIPRVPEKVLDAPEILDDFYLNILDWSMDNLLAIALDREVYLWNASSGDITCLMSAGLEGEYVSSISWSPDSSNVLAIGLSTGRVQLWDATTQALLRTMRLGDVSAGGRVPVVTWREHVVSSGSRSGHIRHHDTRVAKHEIGVSDFHTQEICGLAWSPDKQHLASGGNDNCVGVWPANTISERSAGIQPRVALTDHQAAVKALAWCPWKPNLLCTGGGTNDHTLRFWNGSTGVCVKSVDVVTQVSGIIWNSDYREILTSHGGPRNQLMIWRYPDISRVADLMEHQGRVLCVTSSPNNEMVASCAADETLRIWHCFEVDHTKKRAEEKTQRASVYTRTIR
ncbi:Cell division cycle 20 cofactor of APC complex [Fasciolopsis buskii]|uniref:Cell division cycle 20 cofactor of APC complex n=1 Tax=Fasciolopsis buskii TaxID=27845 RepID=A0A8E0VMK2_9TREM|nr:Cell division cycle 20 cofactor of APC complex [Fasciolopsis buski]